MATNKLNSARLNSLLKMRLSRAESHSDGLGLSVRVTPSKKAGGANNLLWLYRYRVGGRDSNPINLSLGKYPQLSLAKARSKRDQCRQWLAEGKDPRNEYNLDRAESLKPITVADALNHWLEKYAQKKRVNAVKHESQFKRWIIPHVGDLPVSEVSKRHWLACFEARAAKYPVAAGYVLRNLQQALRFCAKRGYEINKEVFDLDFETIGAVKQGKRSRCLVNDVSWEELEQLIKWIDNGRMMPYYRYLLILLINFGCRTQEIRLSKINEWDFDNMMWIVPPEHNKNGDKDKQQGGTGEIKRPIPVALKPWLVALTSNTGNEYLLGELKHSNAVSGWGRGVWKKVGHKQSWCLHDLRRTVSTGMNDIGIAPHVVNALRGQPIKGVEGIYNRSQYLPDKLKALELWQDRLAVLRSDNSNVLLMTGQGK